jgi:hypothetical protein
MQGNDLAQYSIGKMYEHGLGVPQDKSKAREWLEMSAARGNEDAQNALHNL